MRLRISAGGTGGPTDAVWMRYDATSPVVLALETKSAKAALPNRSLVIGLLLFVGFLFGLLVLALLLGLLLRLLLLDRAREDLRLHLVLVLLPLLHLYLVLLELRLELLERRRNVVEGDGSVQLQLVEQLEGLGVVLDGLAGTRLLAALLLARLLGLSGLL